MSELDKRQLVTLLWKEWRQMRGLILIPVLLYLFPWAMGALQLVDARPMSEIVGWFGMLTIVLTCFACGVSCYGFELSAHTTAYLATRPVSFRRSFLVKVGLYLALCWLVALLIHIQHQPFEDLTWWMFSLGLRWYLAAIAFLGAMFVTLLIPNQLLAHILALAVSASTIFWAFSFVGRLWLLVSLLLAIACYQLALRKRTARW